MIIPHPLRFLVWRNIWGPLEPSLEVDRDHSEGNILGVKAFRNSPKRNNRLVDLLESSGRTTMPNPYLPAETLDHIVDFLHDDPNALKGCCPVSKSWVPRARKHLFAEVDLDTKERLESWKRMFSDPSTSPAHFAKSLRVGCACAITAADAVAGGWLTGFTHIVRLEVLTRQVPEVPTISLVPFRDFSDTVKPLHIKSVDLPPSRFFDFILSSPLLEDLTVANHGVWADDGDGFDDPPTFIQSSNPPVFTGSLELSSMGGGMNLVAGRLLSAPGGIHFRKLTLMWHREEDSLSIIGLVRECSHTLESLNITCNLLCAFIPYLRPRR